MKVDDLLQEIMAEPRNNGSRSTLGNYKYAIRHVLYFIDKKRRERSRAYAWRNPFSIKEIEKALQP